MNGEGNDKPQCPAYVVLYAMSNRPIKCTQGRDHVGPHRAYLLGNRYENGEQHTVQVNVDWVEE